MGTFKVVFVLCSILLMFQMGTLEIKSTKSKPDHARRKVAFTDTGGHDDFQKRKLRSTDRESVQLDDNENQGKKREPRTLEEIDFYTGMKIRQGTGHAIPRVSKVDEGSGYQREKGKPGIQDHTESYTSDIGKTGSDSILFTPSKEDERYEDEIKVPEIDDPETNAGDENEKGSDSILSTPSNVDESYEDEIKTPEIDDPETDAGDENEKANTLAADHADEMKYGRRNTNYNQLWETFEAGDDNVDQEGSGGTSLKIGTKSGTEVKGQRPSVIESNGNKLQNVKLEDDTAGKAVARSVEDTHGAGNENEMDVREKTGTDPESTVQEGHPGQLVDGRIIEGSGSAMAEAPAMSDIHVQEGRENRNRGRKSISDNSGHGDGRKFENVHSSPSGKTVSRGAIIDKVRTRISLDEKNDASAANKPATENETAKNSENIGIPLDIVILLIMGISIGCFGTTCCLTKKPYRRSYERAAGEIATPSGQVVRRHDVTSKGRPKTVWSKETSTYAAVQSTDGGTEKFMERAEEAPKLSQDTNDFGQHWNDRDGNQDIKEHRATVNESDRNKLQNTATEETVENVNKRPGKDTHSADNKGFGGIICKMAADHEPEAKEHSASVNQSALQNIEREEDFVEKAKTSPAGDKYGAGKECEDEATELTGKDRVPGVRADGPGTSEDGERIDERSENLDTGMESDGDKLKRITTEAGTVDSKRRGRVEDEHHADNEGFGGLTERVASDLDPEIKGGPASVAESDKCALQNIERVEDIVVKGKTRRTEDKHGASNEIDAEASEMTDKDRVTSLTDEKSTTSEDGGWRDDVKGNLDTGNESVGNIPEGIATEGEAVDNANRGPEDDDHHADNGGNTVITCRTDADQETESEEQLASVKMSDRSALQNIEKEDDIINQAKKALVEDKHESKAKATEMTREDRVTGARDDKPGTRQDEGKIGGRNENLDFENESDGDKPNAITTEVDNIVSKKRGRAECEHDADNEGFGGITDRTASDQDPETKEQPSGVNESDKGALQNIELVEDIVGKVKRRLMEDQHGARNESHTESSETTEKNRVTGLRDETPTTSEDGERTVAAGFGGVACRMASDHDPEAKEQHASVNESDKAARQNIEREEDIADKAKTAPAGDRHGAGNACENEATEMTGKDPVTGVRDDRPGTSDGGERIDGVGGITDRIESDHDPEQTASVNESEKNALQNIEVVECIVDTEKTRRTEDKNSASNESELDAAEMSEKVRRTGLRDEKPKTSKDGGWRDETKENLDTGNESDGNTPERIATEVEAADDEKRGPAVDEHHANNGGFGGVACRMASDPDPEAKEQPASVNESDKAARQNIEREEDIADKAKTAPAGDRQGAGNACEAEATEMTCKDPVTGVRDDRPGTSDGGERIDGE
ncbi:uncharacterized protein [Hemitrygon akajei]|uniref:uncharacterized protein n=1 Tax=Hemitrygon akajei TaxID=2704970 RepID=UPI003BFA2CC3